MAFGPNGLLKGLFNRSDIFLSTEGQTSAAAARRQSAKSDQLFLLDDERHSYWGLRAVLPPFLLASYVRIEWMSLISGPIAARINAAAADDDHDDSAARATIARDGAAAAEPPIEFR